MSTSHPYLPQRAVEYLSEHAGATNAQLAEALDLGHATAVVYRSRFRAQQRASGPEWITALVTEVRLTEDGFSVTFCDPSGHRHEALLPAGDRVPALRRGWRGVFQVWQGAIIEVWT